MSIRERGHRAFPRSVRWLILVLILCPRGRCFSQTIGVYDGFSYTNNRSSVTIGAYHGPGGTVTIPYSIPGIGTVTSIDRDAFNGCTNLASVTIPGTVTSIGIWTFLGCSSLTNVTIGNGITSIGDSAFENCTNLSSAYFQGNPPSTFGHHVFGFFNAPPGFSIYYPSTAQGWTTPTWNTYRAQPYSFQLPVPSLIQGLGAVTPSFSNLQVGTRYQLGISFDLKSWFAGTAFIATNTSEVYPQPFDTRKSTQLFFRLDSAP